MASRPKLVIGCPTYERAWCLPLWFDCINAQTTLLEAYDITFCFAYSRSYDGTFDILENRGSDLGEVRTYQFDLPTWPNRDLERIITLTQLRNALLEMAREAEPDYFLTWDDDVLVPPDVMHKLWVPNFNPRMAVGALIDMGGNDEAMGHPSIMHFPGAPGEIAFRRPFNDPSYDWSQPFPVDIIMAVKLMGKEVYQNTKYRWDQTGEDIGWCLDAHENGYLRVIQPEVRGIHLYDKRISVEIMKKYPNLEYPDLMDHLTKWYKAPEEW